MWGKSDLRIQTYGTGSVKIWRTRRKISVLIYGHLLECSKVARACLRRRRPRAWRTRNCSWRRRSRTCSVSVTSSSSSSTHTRHGVVISSVLRRTTTWRPLRRRRRRPPPHSHRRRSDRSRRPSARRRSNVPRRKVDQLAVRPVDRARCRCPSRRRRRRPAAAARWRSRRRWRSPIWASTAWSTGTPDWRPSPALRRRVPPGSGPPCTTLTCRPPPSWRSDVMTWRHRWIFSLLARSRPAVGNGRRLRNDRGYFVSVEWDVNPRLNQSIDGRNTRVIRDTRVNTDRRHTGRRVGRRVGSCTRVYCRPLRSGVTDQLGALWQICAWGPYPWTLTN